MNVPCTHCRASLDVPAPLLTENRVISCPQCHKPLVVRVDGQRVHGQTANSQGVNGSASNGHPARGPQAVAVTAPPTAPAMADPPAIAAPTQTPAVTVAEVTMVGAPQNVEPVRPVAALEGVLRVRWGLVAIVIGAAVGLVAMGAQFRSDGPPANLTEVVRPEPQPVSPPLTADEYMRKHIEQLRNEKETLQVENKKLQSTLDGMEEQIQQLEQARQELQQKVVLGQRWQQATFVVHSPTFAAGLKPLADGQFEIVATAVHPETEYVEHVARKIGIPRVMGNSKLARLVVEKAKLGNIADANLAARLAQYWRAHKFVEPPRGTDAPFVLFKDLLTNRHRVGFLLETTEDSLTLRSVARSAETIPRTRIESGSPRKGTAARIGVEPEADFLDLAILRLAQQLESEEGVPGLLALAIKVQTDDLAEALALSGMLDTTWNDRFFDFLARSRLEPYRPDARKEPTRVLRRFAEYLHDEIGARLNRLNIPVLEREELQAIADERALADGKSFEPRKYAGLVSASHLLIADVDKPSDGGAFRVSIRLVVADSGMKEFEDQGDVGRVPAKLPERCLLGSGRLALLAGTGGSSRAPAGAMDPLNFAGPQHSPSPARVVVLEFAGGVQDRYRELFGHRLQTLAPEFGRATRLSIGSFQGVPRNQQLRLVTWHLARAILPASGRINSLEGERVVFSIGSEQGVHKGDRFVVVRSHEAATEHDDELLQPSAVLPQLVRADVIAADHSVGYLISSGVDQLWPDSGVRAGDLVLREGAVTPAAYLGKFALDPSLMPKQAAIDERMATPSQLTRLQGTAVHLSERLQDALQRALQRVGVHCVTEPEAATHVVEGEVAPVTGWSNNERFLVQLHVRDRQSRRVTGAVLPITLTIDEVDAWRP